MGLFSNVSVILCRLGHLCSTTMLHFKRHLLTYTFIIKTTCDLDIALDHVI